MPFPYEVKYYASGVLDFNFLLVCGGELDTRYVRGACHFKLLAHLNSGFSIPILVFLGSFYSSG